MIAKTLSLIITLILTLISVCSVQAQLNHLDNFHVKQAQLVRSGLTDIFWNYVDSVNLTSVGILGNCDQSLNFVKKSLEQGNQWPLKLIDASGRAPVELTEDGYLDPGNYDQCLSLSWTGLFGFPEKGQYCLTSILPKIESNIERNNVLGDEKAFNQIYEAVIKIGLCLPSSCSIRDIEIITDKALGHFNWNLVKIDGCQVETTFNEKLNQSPTSQKISFFMLLFTVSTVFFASFLDWTLLGKKLPSHLLNRILCFSVLRNYQQLIHPKSISNHMPYLTWVIMRVHFVVLVLHIAVWPAVTCAITLYAKLFSLFKLTDSPLSLPSVGEWYTEYIFLYGGIARSMNLWKNTGPETSFFVTFKSFMRKTFSLSVVMGILVMTLNLVPLLTNGPLSPITTRYGVGSCAENILYYLSLQQHRLTDLESRNMCLPHTWSIAAEFQLIPVLLVLVHLYKKWPRLGLTVNLCLIFGGLVNVGNKFYYSSAEPHSLINYKTSSDIEEWYVNFYIPSTMHLWLYSATMLMTYLIMISDQNSRLIQIFVKNASAKLWITFVLLNLCPVIWKTFFNENKSRASVVLYVIFYRILSGFFFSCHILRKKAQFKSHFQHPRDLKYSANIKNPDRIGFTQDNDLPKNSLRNSRNVKNFTDFVANNYRIFYILSVILASAYFIHPIVLVWRYSQMRWPVISLSGWILDCLWSIILTWIAGFFFYLFVLAPVASFFSSPKQKVSPHND